MPIIAIQTSIINHKTKITLQFRKASCVIKGEKLSFFHICCEKHLADRILEL